MTEQTVEPREVVDFDALAPGARLPAVSFETNEGICGEYLLATGDGAHAFALAGAVPPACLIALALASMTERMPLPGSTVHTGQEMEFLRAVPTEATVVASFQLLARRRSGAHTTSVFGVTLSHDEQPVAVGRTLLRSRAAAE